MLDQLATAGHSAAMEQPGHRASRARFLKHVALILALTVGLSEGLLRVPPIVARLPLPSVGSGSDLLDIKVEYLERYARAQDSIDCLFIGPSTVQFGIDPIVVSASYSSKYGKQLRCFNFGVEGLALHLAQRLIPLLVAKYRPRLIVLADWRPEKVSDSLAWAASHHPWILHMNGDPSLDGWLIEHSRLVRYFLRLRIWLEQPALNRGLTDRLRKLEPTGFKPLSGSLAPHLKAPDIERWRRILHRLASRPVPGQDLATLARQPAMPPIVLLEMPFPQQFRALFPGGEAGYRALLRKVEEVGLPLLRTSEHAPIPVDGWLDLHHLNDRGAAVFSRWLGAELAELVRTGRIPDPTDGDHARAGR